ncbi:DNA internalization-related competence protein ComEC/Rec2 [Ammoniphilus sp. CFH 90114]|uniref:DNA internalization-related competence protein ComEC/Rec2 n=1 Tax=Ammoniphilus sp. CFH 90114 TaxID=2493665 RepID=UPI00100E5056|nr:DNA internalization-related competence protein ComEC/Rec2 [Ammoniphilus sp. CFH 90114]RXT14802.1 DNA internalization-related competence protein ComEC/Rec2 [Ammoniphilus sp. CFH 90114]
MYSRPMYVASLLLLMGMVMSHYLLHEQYISLTILSVLILIFGHMFKWALSRSYSILLFLLVLTGVSYYYWYDATNQTLLKESESDELIRGRIVSQVQVDGDLAKFRLKVMEVQALLVDEAVECRIYLKSKEEQEQATKLIFGTYVEFKGQLKAPEGSRNPGSFDYRQYLYYKRIHWLVISTSLADLKAYRSANIRPDVVMNRVRDYLERSLERTFPAGSSEIMKALLLGIKVDLPQDVTDIYGKLGLIHVLAISGLHMSIIAGGIFILGILRFIGFTRETSIILTVLTIPIYIVLAGAAPSIVRSGIMAVISLVGVYLHRGRDGLNLWGTALFLMLIYNPYYLWDIGFQLSFLVTWGLILFVPYMRSFFHFLPDSLSSLLAVAVTAQWVSFPLIVYYFHHYHLLSLLANILFVPLYSIVFIPMGFALFILGFVHPGLVQLWAEGLAYGFQWMNRMIEWIAGWHGFQRHVAPPEVWWMVIYYIVLCGSLWIMKGRRLLWLFLLMSVILSLSFIPWQGEQVKITFVDVGQGDAIVIQLPNKRVYLIDGGGVLTYDKGESWRKRKSYFDPGKDIVVPFLKSQGINEVHTLVITHGDIDHIGGLYTVVEDIPIRRVLINGTQPKSKQETELYQLLNQKQIPIYQGRAGDWWKDAEEIEWKILHPSAVENESDNNSSLVLLLNAYGYKILFTGDLEREGENRLIESGDLDKIHLLKVAHHGSKSSTTEAWLDRLQPDYSIISAGRLNRYGHPHEEVLTRLHQVNSRIFRTDKQGAVMVELRPTEMKVWTYLQPSQ